ncbi:MAG: IucA/IucC family protein, partial [Acinetobacter sp.]|nr:IucA/IucC family protein [Acinetobacter sp.]
MSFAQLQINQNQWRSAGQRLIEMAIAEFLYEEIIQAESLDNDVFQLRLDDRIYQFNAQQYLLGHWQIQEGSVRDLNLDTRRPA